MFDMEMSREAVGPHTHTQRRQPRKGPMPVSKCTLVGSVVLWGSILTSGFFFVSYITVYMTLGNDEDIKGDCLPPSHSSIKSPTKTIESFSAVDISKIQRTEEFKRAELYLKLDSATFPKLTPKSDIPPFVTAVSSATFYKVQGLLRQIVEELLPLYRGKAEVKLVVFDLGVTEAERNVFKRHCRCELWKMDNSVLPRHVTNIELHAYRSVVIQYILSRFGSVIWMDPMTRLVSARVPDAIKDARERGLNLWHYSFRVPVPVPATDTDHYGQFVYDYERLVAYTNPATFKYLNEKRCKHRRSHVIDTRMMIFYDTDVVRKYVIKPWVSCVLDADCVSPRSSRYTGCFEDKSPSYTGCHRYEMSVLGIVAGTLPGYLVERSFQPVLDVNIDRDIKDPEPDYFPERPLNPRRRNTIMITVVVCVVVISTSSIWGSLVIRSIGMLIAWLKPKSRPDLKQFIS